MKLNDVKDAVVNVTFDPPWSPEMLTEEGKVKLGFKSNKTKKNEDNWE